MADEILDNLDSEEQEDEKKSKVGLVIAFIMLAFVLIMLIGGSVLFFVIRDRDQGQINIEDDNINIEAVANITGIPNESAVNANLERIRINATESSGQDSWSGLNLIFTEESSIITITITLYNRNDINQLVLDFRNETTTTSIDFNQFYYIDGLTSTQTPMLNDPSQANVVYLNPGQFVTFVVNISIKSGASVVADTLDIDIHCNNIEQ